MANEDLKSSHKTTDKGVPITDIASYFRENRGIEICQLNFDTTSQGGLVKDVNGIPVSWILPPFWRNGNGDLTLITTNDIKGLFLTENPNAGLTSIKSGGELELYIWNPITGEMAPAMLPNSPIRTTLADHKRLIEETNGNGISFFEDDDPFTGNLIPADHQKVGISDEFLLGQIELNFPPAQNPHERSVPMIFALKKIAKLVSKFGWSALPISTQPHRPIIPSDINPNPYIQKISQEFMGADNSRHFVGASWQTHVEMLDLELALQATNRMQEVTPILYALSLAGPFLNGQIRPQLSSNFETNLDGRNQEKKLSTYSRLLANETNGSHYSSVRYFARIFGSPSGGVMREPLPETAEEFFNIAENLLRSGEIPSPARVSGHHTDFRIRPDIGPYGTIEVACLDTFGGHPLKLAAIQEFIRVLGWKLQLMAKKGNLYELHQRYPALFTVRPDAQRYDEVHNATIDVAINGTNTVISGADGNKYQVAELYQQLENFVDKPIIDETDSISYQGLPPQVKNLLRLSFQIPNGDLSRYFLDSRRLPSVFGYYATGAGTLSDWLILRANQYRQSCPNATDKEIIEDCMTDLGKSYHQYLSQLTGYDVEQLFSN